MVGRHKSIVLIDLFKHVVAMRDTHGVGTMRLYDYTKVSAPWYTIVRQTGGQCDITH